MLKIGFIGMGKVGRSLSRYFLAKQLPVIGYYQHTSKTYPLLSSFTQLAALVEQCDLLFLTLPDGKIADVWQMIKQSSIDLHGKYMAHCSGLLSSAIFNDIEQRGAYGFSLHPLYAFGEQPPDMATLQQLFFTIEGNVAQLPVIEDFFKQLGNTTSRIAVADKPRYHAAAVIISNFVTGLAYMAQTLLTHCQLENNMEQHAWRLLLRNQVEQLCQQSIIDALTGPIERGDLATIQQHLAHLPDDFRRLYLNLSNVMLAIAKEKHPQRDYRTLEQEIGDEK